MLEKNVSILQDVNFDSNAWRNNIHQYEQEKKNLQWGSNPQPKFITNKMVKDKEHVFNPISQKYYEESRNSQIKFEESKKLVSAIANGYDNKLRMEQTFDIVNLKDKLKGFEGHSNYPKPKKDNVNKKNLEVSRVNYNILSNITLDKHHYLPEECRPKIEEKNQNKSNKINLVNYKDYNLITNKYTFNHEEKAKVDMEIEKYAAAQNYWKIHDYNLITGKYYDKEKDTQMVAKINKKVNRNHE